MQLIFKTPLLHRISQRKVRIGLSQQQSSNSADYTHLSAVQCGVRTPRGKDYVVQIDHIKDKTPQITTEASINNLLQCHNKQGNFWFTGFKNQKDIAHDLQN